MSPPIPLKSFALEFRKCMRLLLSVPMRILLVCDGQRHPHKKQTDDERASSLSVNKERLDLLLKRSDLSKEETTEVNKLKRKCVWVRENVLESAIEICIKENWPFFCAPYEADFEVSRRADRCFVMLSFATHVASELTLGVGHGGGQQGSELQECLLTPRFFLALVSILPLLNYFLFPPSLLFTPPFHSLPPIVPPY